ncbi:SDR family oxidoreductase [soil metagenome]
MRVLVIGGTGMLGHKLVQTLGDDLEVWTTIRRPFSQVERFNIFDRRRTVENLNVLDNDALRSAIDLIKPSVVINAVGVIKQVPAADDPAEMIKINAVLPNTLASMSRDFAFRLICISTDCVFSGKSGNYREDDLPDAVDLYGESKYNGEVKAENCLTLRTSMIGRELDTCHSLLEWLLSNRGGEVKGFVNAIFSGFSTKALARLITSIIKDHPTLLGLYHLSSEPISKYELLKMLERYFNADIQIIPDDSLNIDRSLNSDRFWERTGLMRPSWPQMIMAMAEDPTPYDEFHGII